METLRSPEVRGERHIRDDVEYTFSDTHHEYVVPRTSRRRTQKPFHKLQDALWTLKSFATSTEQDDLQSSLVYTHRRFGRVFNSAYDLDGVDKTTLLPTPKEFLSEVMWAPDSHSIPARTIVVEKTEDELLLTHKHGFNATEQVMELEPNEKEEMKGALLYHCGDGVKYIHAPYKPSRAEEWRYRPSKMAISYEQTEDNKLRVGIASDPPETPIWYHVHKRIFPMAGPYAKVTFEWDEQTRTKKYLMSENADSK